MYYRYFLYSYNKKSHIRIILYYNIKRIDYIIRLSYVNELTNLFFQLILL